MILILLGVVAVSVLGMLLLPLRHLRQVREHHMKLAAARSVVRAPVIGMIERVDRWYRGQAREWMLKIADRLLKISERTLGQLAGRAKSLRFMIQEHFKVIPRESMYWKQIQTWKRVNETAPAKVFAETRLGADSDVSNHLY